jgi:hypothetical protein
MIMGEYHSRALCILTIIVSPYDIRYDCYVFIYVGRIYAQSRGIPYKRMGMIKCCTLCIQAPHTVANVHHGIDNNIEGSQPEIIIIKYYRVAILSWKQYHDALD